MEANFQGDFADIVRASRGGAVAAPDGYHKYFSENSDRFQPLDPARDDGFGDLFPTVTDPFLFELEGIGPSFTPTSGMLETAPSQISSDTAELVSNGSAFAQKPTCDLQGVGGVISRDQGVISSINYGSSHKASSLIETARGQICSPRNWTTNKRKSLAKKVVCIPAPAATNSRQGGGEVVPSDLWAWRKYGQKPIKGSPYPRGYYRCSSSKGCPARKQVERSRTDPNMLVITYTSEHNHPWPTQRNSLAGSTRIPSKPETQKTTTMKEVEANNHHDTTSSIKGHKNDQEEDANKGLNRIPSDYDLISDLRDLEAHPLNTLFNPSGFTGESDEDVSGGSKSKSMLDPFGSLFDWP